MTSHDVVARIRRLAGTRKVGHAGTLDPMATGVLVVGLNRATRLLGHLLLTDKAYDATIRLGVTTTTDDAEGEVVATVAADVVTDDGVRAGLAAMVGEIAQVPSSVSAIKVDGRRAYERVRAGEEVELAARAVRIDAIDVSAIRRDDPGTVDVDVSVRCSSGTYVRAIARDLGVTLGVGGHLTALRRTAVGAFGLDVARTLDELAEELTVAPIGDAARTSFPAVDLPEELAVDVRHGRRLALDLEGDGPHALFAPDGEFLALYEPDDDGARAVAVFV
jgi:tRNA pseudouridine55 synthase